MGIETGQQLREAIQGLDMTMMDLARLMRGYGDTRSEQVVWRWINRMVHGQAPVSGPMQALIGVLQSLPTTMLEERGKRAGCDGREPAEDVRRWKLGPFEVEYAREV